MKVNLETLLINQNRKLTTPEELLLIKEYDTHSEYAENDALSRVGLNVTLKTGKALKDKISRKQQETKNFKQERVFHVSQIKAICDQYYLRFLDSSLYKGTIDKDLPTKITNFEAAYNVRCNSSNTKICAPPESFNLEEEPKDPLFFYRINDEYYYLIHKWGNDLSVYRKIKYALFSNIQFAIIMLSFVLWSPIALIGIDGFIAIASVTYVTLYLFGLFTGDPVRFIQPNKWESEKV